MILLPNTSIVNRFIAKNSFDKYITPKQKKLFSEYVDKITWTNKLSAQTINLEGKIIEEIQVFEVLLRQKIFIEELLNIIDRYIPYHIIFILKFDGETMYSAAQKHPNPSSENTSVTDWRFLSDWAKDGSETLQVNLKTSLDDTFANFCFKLSGQIPKEQNLDQLIQKLHSIKRLNSDINKLESEIKNCKQFNRKVELNQQLSKFRVELEELNENHS